MLEQFQITRLLAKAAKFIRGFGFALGHFHLYIRAVIQRKEGQLAILGFANKQVLLPRLGLLNIETLHKIVLFLCIIVDGSNYFLYIQLLNDEYVIAVGTTSVRVLESLYWCGVNVVNKTANPFCVDQFAAFNEGDKVFPDYKVVLSELIKYLEKENMEQLIGITSIMIFPGYDFKIVRGLVTNFHQPKSTLLLLISAFVNQNWKEIYQYALNHQYRFLSYGDSSILLR